MKGTDGRARRKRKNNKNIRRNIQKTPFPFYMDITKKLPLTFKICL